MTDLNHITWGRLEEKRPSKLAQNYRYRFGELGLPTAENVEVELALPPGLVAHYDQGNTGACTGYSASWMDSINNYRERGIVLAYDAHWLYHRGQQIDGDPNTNGDQDGGYVWAVHDVLRNEGHRLKGTSTTVKAEGIESYYWCRSADEARTAFSLGRCPVFGIAWFNKFMSPKLYNGEYWIGRESSWGQVLGGHAIAARRCSDSRGGFLLRNSWGAGYPEVWISFTAINKLLSGGGECAVAIDRANVTPPPPPPPAEKDYVDIEITNSNGKHYKVRAYEV